MSKFKNGDRVYIKKLRNSTRSEKEYLLNYGMTGTVLEDYDSRPWVEFDTYIGGEHSYHGSKKGYTMCMWQDEIEHMKPEPFLELSNENDIGPLTMVCDDTRASITLNGATIGKCLSLKGENKNMKILDIYEYRKLKSIDQELKEEKEKIDQEDPFVKILIDAENKLKALYKEEYSRDIPDYNYNIHSSVRTIDTYNKIEEVEKEIQKNQEKLYTILQEVKAQLELTNDYDKQIAILKNYGILDKKGQINA